MWLRKEKARSWWPLRLVSRVVSVVGQKGSGGMVAVVMVLESLTVGVSAGLYTGEEGIRSVI